MRYFNPSYIGAMIFFGSASMVSADPSVLWDEAVAGDLSNSFSAPTQIAVSKPGEYFVRVTTGPMIPVLRDKQAPMPGPLIDTLKRMDQNEDGRLQQAETRENFTFHFKVYDLNNDGELEFEEIGKFKLGGDGHDIFDFVQADGINLVSIKINKYDSGGIRNNASVLVVIDEKTGRPAESLGVEITDKELDGYKPFAGDLIAGIAREGEEIYDQYKLWKAYRRNDASTYFRIGEGQEKAKTELIFVFE